MSILKDTHLFMHLLVSHLHPVTPYPLQPIANVTHGVFIVALEDFSILLYDMYDVLSTVSVLSVLASSP